MYSLQFSQYKFRIYYIKCAEQGWTNANLEIKLDKLEGQFHRSNLIFYMADNKTLGKCCKVGDWNKLEIYFCLEKLAYWNSCRATKNEPCSQYPEN